MAAPTATERFINFLTGTPIALFDAVGSIFNPSGPTSSIGLVPNPGATPGTSKFLREDATWNNAPAPAAGSITNAQLADMAQSTIKGRAVGAGTGVPQDLTNVQATAILDAFVGDSGAGGTKGLVPAPAAGDAAANKFLNASGAFAAIPNTNPSLTLIASGSLSGAAVALTGIPATYRFLVLFLVGLSTDTASRGALVTASTNNGVSYDTTAANYVRFFASDATNFASSITGTASFPLSLNWTAASTTDYLIYINNYIGTVPCVSQWYIVNSGGTTITTGTTFYRGSALAINALNISINGTGNFDAGTYALYGGT